MKNVNYNLVKTLHNTLDDIWRLEHYYVEDAKKAKCHSVSVMKRMMNQRKKDAKALVKEIKMRMDAGIFN
ncbi:hypothetical protein KJZ71_02465 [Patescibacteria group bacterium]|uniref:Uncharacterized protein n=1 Tax=candidate division WWE3 bacterium TaxID=2053526 RepID=A0A928TXF4_UNCKA|nr:hypothetical protein [candidate division WWE3 bacterium]MCL4732649.1 hypothetical protein [Patescibacteria group bacterium]MDL1952697.1 hypothetical protein [Candidatus Uhrbacteria bacterium UHB]RIL01173.1 MAG: hypothetical protein DCC77_01380 [Candidatus Uhrbacteria bacterium]